VILLSFTLLDKLANADKYYISNVDCLQHSILVFDIVDGKLQGIFGHRETLVPGSAAPAALAPPGRQRTWQRLEAF